MSASSWKNIGIAAASAAVLIVGASLIAKFFAPPPPPPLTLLPAPPENAPYRDASLPVDERVEDLLGRMTLEEKVGQMTLVEKNSLKKKEDVAVYGLGAVLSGSGGNPDDNTPKGWVEMVAGFQEAARKTRLGIPLLYGVDANHGSGNVPGATLFPHAIGLGAAGDPALAERVARATAEESAALGARWNFSPMLELPRDIRWGRVYEAFSDDASSTAALGAAYVRGLQEAPGRPGRIDVLATAKHYVGLGSSTWGTSRDQNYHIDQGVIPDDEAALRDIYLPPYRKAIEAGAMSVMAGIGSWGDTPIPASKHLLTDTLKGRLGFRGFVVSDWYGVYDISWSKYDATVRAVNAGVDMAMLPFDYPIFVSDMRKAVQNGDIPQSRVDDAVRRILRAKFAMGLFDGTAPSAPDLGVVGSQAHRALARQAVRESLVLLKNRSNVLPLSADVRHIRVAGSAADNIGRQAGGWTVEWQGIDGNWLPGAASILSGIRADAGDRNVEYDLNGDFPQGGLADVGIAVVGEKPYAEGVGDDATPQLDDADLATIANLRKTSRKVVVILVSGRPLIVTDEIPKWDAAVEAWLPGSEGAGVADALFGASPFTGALPLPWPHSIDQLPMRADGLGKDGRAPLFPRGYGLRPSILP